VSSLGGANQFFMRTEGWATDRSQGDAFTPNPSGSGLGASSDVHQISAVNGAELTDATLTNRGGPASHVAKCHFPLERWPMSEEEMRRQGTEAASAAETV